MLLGARPLFLDRPGGEGVGKTRGKAAAAKGSLCLRFAVFSGLDGS